MPVSLDAIVLGLGGFGSAACAHLAGRGLHVLGLDQFSRGHDRGSSHGETRIIRMAYFEHPDYVPLLRRAYSLWQALERDSGDRLYQQTGLLLSGPEEGETIAGALNAAQRHSLPLERLSPRETFVRYPGIRLPEDHTVLLESDAGFLAVEACVRAHLNQARSAGATLLDETPVRQLEILRDSVVVHTDRDVFSAARLVVAAGAWTGRLLTDFAIHLTPSRKFVGWFDVLPGAYLADRGFPCFFVEQPHGSFYGFPSLDGRVMKVAEHSGVDPVADPSQVDRACRPDDLPRLTEFLRQVFPQATSRLARHSVCMYTMSPDSHFIVDRLPHAPHVSVACGFSGHGFKFTSVIGEALADLVVNGRTDLPIEFLGLKRLMTR